MRNLTLKLLVVVTLAFAYPQPSFSQDVAPTASIAQPPGKPDGLNLAPPSGPSAGELTAAIPPGISASLRDATAAGQPNAQYELAMRLFEGRGLPKDQPAAARWFERAAVLGLAPAQYRLGSMYEKGLGVNDKIILEGVRQVRDGEKVEYEFRKPEEALANQKNHAE